MKTDRQPKDQDKQWSWRMDMDMDMDRKYLFGNGVGNLGGRGVDFGFFGADQSTTNQTDLLRHLSTNMSSLAINIDALRSQLESSSGVGLCCFCLCGLPFLALIIGLLYASGIIPIVIADVYGSSSCIATSALVSFSYKTWLLVYGSLWIILVTIFVWFTLKLRNSPSSELAFCFLMFQIAWAIFDLAWYIVGGILYFETIDYHCAQNDSIRVFGLVWFILQTAAVPQRWSNILNQKI